MAILKAIGNPSKSIGGAKKCLDYVGNKAERTEGLYCSSDYKKAFEDFQDTKEFYNKKDGRQFLHFVQSFKHGEVNEENALELTKKFCEKTMNNNEVFLAVHNDKDHIHCHIVVNSVSFENGLKFQCSGNDLKIYKEIANEINKDFGLKIPEKSKIIGNINAYSRNKHKSIEEHFKGNKKSDIVNVYTILNKSLSENEFKNKNEFKIFLEKNSIKVDWQDNKKNITFELDEKYAKSEKNKFRLTNLSKTFNDPRLTKENLIEFFKINEKNLEISKQKEQEKTISRGGFSR